MPRPRRTRVASSVPRDLSSPSTLPGRQAKKKIFREPPQAQDDSAQVEHTENKVDEPKRGRGRPPNNKKDVAELSEPGVDPLLMEDVEISKGRRGRPSKKKAAAEEPSHLEEDTTRTEKPREEGERGVLPLSKANVRTRRRAIMKKTVASMGQQSALEALKQRRDAAVRAKKAKDAPSAALPAVAPAPNPNALQRLLRTSSTPKSSDERVASTPPTKVSPPAQSKRTPSSRLDIEEDLYALSPAGEASRLRLESRRQQHPQIALKAQGTPAVETSVLALANFKRRPRQGSIIRMVQQTSEMGDPAEHSDVDIEDDPLLQGLENTMDHFEDFDPENESTPVHEGKRKSTLGADEPRTSSSRKRKNAAEDEEIQVLQSSPPIPSSPPERQQSLTRSSSLTSLPEVVESTQKSRELDVYSETMAPPQSSSEPASPVQSPIRADKRRKLSDQHVRENEDEGSPSRGHAKKRTPHEKPPGMSTATLQSLLPKPRRKIGAVKHVNDYKFPSSGGDTDAILTLQDTDDDELARPRASRRATKTPMRKVSGNRKMAAATILPASTKKKTPSTKANGKEMGKPKAKKTYGRAADEKENDHSTDLPSDQDSDDEGEGTKTVGSGKARAGSVAILKASKAKELVEAKQKFAEVDDFEMDFESVDLGGGSSSPWR